MVFGWGKLSPFRATRKVPRHLLDPSSSAHHRDISQVAHITLDLKLTSPLQVNLSKLTNNPKTQTNNFTMSLTSGKLNLILICCFFLKEASEFGSCLRNGMQDSASAHQLLKPLLSFETRSGFLNIAMLTRGSHEALAGAASFGAFKIFEDRQRAEGMSYREWIQFNV